MPELTADRLRALVRYDESTGRFSWIPRTGRGAGWAKADREPGGVTSQGYRSIRLDGRLYQAHRLAWLYVHGEWPQQQIDHVNGNRLDNRIENLRDVAPLLNQQNMRRARCDNETGVLGVTVDRRRGGFKARIRAHGRILYLGNFGSIEQAQAVYVTAKRSLHEGATI